MIHTAEALVAPGKGILTADESTPTMAKRLAGVGLESTEQRRRAYRQILFTTEGIGESISGVILFDETIRQRADDGTPFPELLRRQGVIPESKSMVGRSRSPASRMRWSPRGSTGCVAAWRSMPPWEPASPSGARSSASGKCGPRPPA